jgi:hypothetical protein
MMDDLGQPDGVQEQTSRTTPDADTSDTQEDTLSLNTQQVAQQLGVDSRTIRRYISEGLRTGGGSILKLKARQVRSSRGPEWQVYQTDLEAFKRERDRQATEGQPSTRVTIQESEIQSQALSTLSTSLQIFAAELERRSLALNQAQETIERLSYEAGRQAGRNEQLGREITALRQRVAELEAQAQQVQELPKTPQPPRRMRLLPWRPKSDQ